MMNQAPLDWEKRVWKIREHFQGKGYRVHSGLQFGCELVLYADDPSKVHSDFAVHVVPEDGSIDWRQIQSLARSMPGLHKTLIIVFLDGDEVHELAMATEHAPFRHRKVMTEVGAQRKKARTDDEGSTTNFVDNSSR